jgi:hypothetical protein
MFSFHRTSSPQKPLFSKYGEEGAGDFNRRPDILECIRVTILFVNRCTKSVANTSNTTSRSDNIKTASFATQDTTNVIANFFPGCDNSFNDVASLKAKMNLFAFTMSSWETVFISASIPR